MTNRNRPTPEQLSEAKEKVAASGGLPREDPRRYGKGVRLVPAALADRKPPKPQAEPQLGSLDTWSVGWIGGRYAGRNSQSIELRDTRGELEEKRVRLPIALLNFHPDPTRALVDEDGISDWSWEGSACIFDESTPMDTHLLVVQDTSRYATGGAAEPVLVSCSTSLEKIKRFEGPSRNPQTGLWEMTESAYLLIDAF